MNLARYSYQAAKLYILFAPFNAVPRVPSVYWWIITFWYVRLCYSACDYFTHNVHGMT